MSKLKQHLPQLDGGLFLTDGGIETTLIFHDKLELPHFAAFHLLASAEGRRALAAYYRRYLEIAARDKTGFILESPTWRASPDWGAKLGYTREALAASNRTAIEMMRELRLIYDTPETPVVVSGCVGPRGDGYVPGLLMSPGEARAYHEVQISALAEAGADMIAAITMTNAEEAIGVTDAAVDAGLPVAISFTVETDGRLPTGQPLGQAIAAVDDATDHAPVYYMINCAHPSHFAAKLDGMAPWMTRIKGLRANASMRSHQELNDAPDLDEGDPAALSADYAALVRRFPGLTILGGCCGTDHRHVAAISAACGGHRHRAAA